MATDKTTSRKVRVSTFLIENLDEVKKYYNAKSIGDVLEKALMSSLNHKGSSLEIILHEAEKSYEDYTAYPNHRKDVAEHMKGNVEDAKRELDKTHNLKKTLFPNGSINGIEKLENED